MICFCNVKKKGRMKHLKRSMEDEQLFSLVNITTIRVAKIQQSIASYYVSSIANFEALVEFESQSDSKYELTNLDFSTRTLKFKPKKLPLGIKLLQNLPNGTKFLQNLSNFCAQNRRVHLTHKSPKQ